MPLAGTYTVTLDGHRRRWRDQHPHPVGHRRRPVAACRPTPTAPTSTFRIARPWKLDRGIRAHRQRAHNAQVGVNIVHTYRGDLRIHLVAPDGSLYLLKQSNASDSTDNVIATYTVNLSSEALNGNWSCASATCIRATSASSTAGASPSERRVAVFPSPGHAPGLCFAGGCRQARGHCCARCRLRRRAG